MGIETRFSVVSETEYLFLRQNLRISILSPEAVITTGRYSRWLFCSSLNLSNRSKVVNLYIMRVSCTRTINLFSDVTNFVLKTSAECRFFFVNFQYDTLCCCNVRSSDWNSTIVKMITELHLPYFLLEVHELRHLRRSRPKSAVPCIRYIHMMEYLRIARTVLVRTMYYFVISGVPLLICVILNLPCNPVRSNLFIFLREGSQICT